MPLTDAERERIYEEERARREVRTPMGPTDQVFGCLQWGCVLSIAAVVLIGIIVAGMVAR